MVETRKFRVSSQTRKASVWDCLFSTRKKLVKPGSFKLGSGERVIFDMMKELGFPAQRLFRTGMMLRPFFTRPVNYYCKMKTTPFPYTTRFQLPVSVHIF